MFVNALLWTSGLLACLLLGICSQVIAALGRWIKVNVSDKWHRPHDVERRRRDTSGRGPDSCEHRAPGCMAERADDGKLRCCSAAEAQHRKVHSGAPEHSHVHSRSSEHPEITALSYRPNAFCYFTSIRWIKVGPSARKAKPRGRRH
jgi:hypothetical protein